MKSSKSDSNSKEELVLETAEGETIDKPPSNPAKVKTNKVASQNKQTSFVTLKDNSEPLEVLRSQSIASNATTGSVDSLRIMTEEEMKATLVTYTPDGLSKPHWLLHTSKKGSKPAPCIIKWGNFTPGLIFFGFCFALLGGIQLGFFFQYYSHSFETLWMMRISGTVFLTIGLLAILAGVAIFYTSGRLYRRYISEMEKSVVSVIFDPEVDKRRKSYGATSELPKPLVNLQEEGPKRDYQRF